MNESETKIGRNVSAFAPKVSVVIPAYNIADYIGETLDSVLAQTFQDYEIILVNDGSPHTSQLESALAPFLDNIIYVKQENAGASAARNTAISLARGELLAFLDGDDVWLPKFLESQTIYLEKNGLEMVYCDALIFGERLFENQTFMQTAPSVGTVSTVSLINAECNVITSGTVLKKEMLEKCGLFDVKLRRAQDFDLWFRLAKNNVRIGYQREVLLKYRVRPDNLSGTNVDRAKRNVEVMRFIGGKYELNEIEREAWAQYSRLCEAELELEKGKLCLIEGDFIHAQAHLAEANKFYRKPKLSLINWLLRISPRLTVRLFKAIRPSEFSFVSPNKS
jgi:glycosyltransferase involved in cell wall biosynthesis